jgi:hypothetical protein
MCWISPISRQWLTRYWFQLIFREGVFHVIVEAMVEDMFGLFPGTN